MYPEIYDPTYHHHHARLKKHSLERAFKCLQCDAHVYTQPQFSGVQNRNHCPYCLYSRHVDHIQPGDRMSACKAIMRPIGLTVKPRRSKYGAKASGELMLIHLCSECGKLSINRIAADDQMERLMEIFYVSLELDALIKQQISSQGIYILQQEEREIVFQQLHGIAQI